ncbi:transposase [Lactobacillus gasseri SV-16A-US]|uniref:Transposase n=1 Tax=Lactobacillus gasseri SV-16A-US TaxID=575604 RepID=A0AB34P190_LACGS|nr:transposase [Lactobacillus gasseri SV-16A-US]
MSSNNGCIKFHLNIEDPNIVFPDYFKKYINGKYHNVYQAELIQPSCPFWRP